VSVRSRLLSVPLVYDLLQNGISRSGSRDWLVNQVIRPKTGQRILDIGCGTAKILNRLNGIQYFGIDHNPKYVEKARERFGTKGEFHCIEIEDIHLERIGKFDVVLLLGVLHHLDDATIRRLFGQINLVLSPDGVVVTIDPSLESGQHPIARLLAILDRGKFVRNSFQYREFLESSFSVQSQIVRDDLNRVPYTHAIFRVSKQ